MVFPCEEFRFILWQSSKLQQIKILKMLPVTTATRQISFSASKRLAPQMIKCPLFYTFRQFEMYKLAMNTNYIQRAWKKVNADKFHQNYNKVLVLVCVIIYAYTYTDM